MCFMKDLRLLHMLMSDYGPLIVLVLFCSCYVFIVSLISFAAYIIINYMGDVRLLHLNKITYLLTYLL